jgi:enhancer of mRNA-decapping protein 4
MLKQVELATLLTTTPPPLSQGVLLALVLQLGCDLVNDTGKKLAWIKDAALALNPHEPGLPPHVVRHYLEQLYTNLHALLARSHMTADLVHATRLVIHVVNSLLTAYK